MLLAIDTSTSQASIALVRVPAHANGGATADDAPPSLLAELTWEVGQRHSAELLPRLRWVLDATGQTTADATMIAVALGPGSFNGVRVALTCAKALSFARAIPIVGVPTLDVIAWGSHLAEGPLWALLEAGRGQVYAARYAAPGIDPAAWAPDDAISILAPEEVAARAADAPGSVVTFCGEWREATRQVIADALATRGLSARFAPRLGGRRASWLAALALARAARGQYDDPMSIEPLYVRRPAITQPSARTRRPTAQADHGQHAGHEIAPLPDRRAAEGSRDARGHGHRHGAGGQRRGDDVARRGSQVADGEESRHALRG